MSRRLRLQLLRRRRSGQRRFPTANRPSFRSWQLPNTVASVTRQQIERKINIVDTEDAVRYMPSLFVRKRNSGDTQAVLQTRTWGVGLLGAQSRLCRRSAADRAHRQRPYDRRAALGPGRAGGNRARRFPLRPFRGAIPRQLDGRRPEDSRRACPRSSKSRSRTPPRCRISRSGERSRGFVNNVSSFFVGDKVGDFLWTVSGNWQRGSQQPLTYVTTPNFYPGGYLATNVYGTTFANVIGSTGNLANDQVNAKLKFAYDFTNTIRGTYTFGFWSNDGQSYPENYLYAGGGPFWGVTTAPSSVSNAPSPALSNAILQNFATQGRYRVQEKIMVNAAAVTLEQRRPVRL